MNLLTAALLLVTVAAGQQPCPAAVENDGLRVSFSVNTFVVLDKRNGMRWAEADTNGRRRKWCRATRTALQPRRFLQTSP